MPEPTEKPKIKTDTLGKTSQTAICSTLLTIAPNIAETSKQSSKQQIQAFSKKPQISSIPGVPPRERHRYRVTLGDKLLGEYLDLDQALQLVKGGVK
jgi:hypothetical protein